MSSSPPPDPPLAQEAAGFDVVPEQFLVLSTCRDEQHQVELLARFQRQGLPCKAVLS